MNGDTGKSRRAAAPRRPIKAAHEAHEAHDEPLTFFTGEEPRAKTSALGARTLAVAGAAGLIFGLAAVGAWMTFGGGDSPAAGRLAEAPRQAAQKDFLWQRPVIGAKSDLSGEISQTASVAPPAADAALPPDEGLAKAPPMPLMTAFAPASGMDSSGFGKDAPSILQASLALPPASGANETIIAKSPPPEPVDADFVLGKGERVADKLVALGVPEDAARALARAIEPVYPSRLLRAGQKFSVTLDRQQDFYGSEVIYPVYLSFSPGKGEKVIVEADDEGRFVARAEGLKKKEKTARAAGGKKDAKQAKDGGRKAAAGKPGFVHARGRVTSSLYAAARDQRIPTYIINQMLRAFSYDIDLQRQVAKGDVFEVLYGPPLSGSSKRRKVLYYAALRLRSGKKVYYRFTTPRGRTAYFDPKGHSAVKGLMRTPVSGARITSGFGMRRHPILGYSKMHTGVDFAAPRGTPIHAAGAGVVTYAAWRGGYGRAVMIRHDNGYVTMYAHQSRIARGIRKGVRVRQGQVIGYVGSTGRATGPHLHFEVRLNKRPVNPLRVRTTNRIRLRGKALAAFRKRKARIDFLLRQTPAAALVARN